MEGEEWACHACTLFTAHGHLSCDACGTERQSAEDQPDVTGRAPNAECLEGWREASRKQNRKFARKPQGRKPKHKVWDQFQTVPKSTYFE